MDSDHENLRLETKTSIEAVRHRLQLIGLQPGSRCLDAGCGTGTGSRVIAAHVGVEGTVVALDRSETRTKAGRRLASEAGVANLEFVRGDILAPPFEPGSFDFVFCEFVFEYLDDPTSAVMALSTLVKPGGKLVVTDIDGAAMNHFPEPALVRDGMRKIAAQLDGVWDPFAGRKLFNQFRTVGLRDVRMHMLPHHFYAGAIPDRDLSNWETKWSTIEREGTEILGSKSAYKEFRDVFVEMLKDPDTLTYSVLFIAEWTKPVA